MFNSFHKSDLLWHNFGRLSEFPGVSDITTPRYATGLNLWTKLTMLNSNFVLPVVKRIFLIQNFTSFLFSPCLQGKIWSAHRSWAPREWKGKVHNRKLYSSTAASSCLSYMTRYDIMKGKSVCLERLQNMFS